MLTNLTFKESYLDLLWVIYPLIRRVIVESNCKPVILCDHGLTWCQRVGSSMRQKTRKFSVWVKNKEYKLNRLSFWKRHKTLRCHEKGKRKMFSNSYFFYIIFPTFMFKMKHVNRQKWPKSAQNAYIILLIKGEKYFKLPGPVWKKYSLNHELTAANHLISSTCVLFDEMKSAKRSQKMEK